MVKKYVAATALALVSSTGWAQEPQDSIESVDKYLNLKEVVIKGGLPHTRLKGNAMVTRVDGTALASSGSLGELLVKVPGMTGTDEAPEVLGKGAPLIYINGRKMRDESELKRLRSEDIRDVEVLHALCQRVGRQIERLYHTVGLQAQEARTFRQAPRIIDGVMVPLPVQTEFGIREVIALHDGHLGLPTLVGQHRCGHLTVHIAKHRPSVDPTTGHHGKHTAHAPTILEDNTIPVAVRRIDDGALSLVGESSEL